MAYLGLSGVRDIDDQDLGFSVWPGIRIILILSRLFVQGYESCSYLGLFGVRDIDDQDLGFSVWPGIRIMLILKVIWCQGYESSHT